MLKLLIHNRNDDLHIFESSFRKKQKAWEFSIAYVYENHIAFANHSDFSWEKPSQMHSDKIGGVCNLKIWTLVTWCNLRWIWQRPMLGIGYCVLQETWEAWGGGEKPSCAGMWSSCVIPSVQLWRVQKAFLFYIFICISEGFFFF